MSMQSSRHHPAGFSVVELVITITICGIIVPVLAAGLSQLTALNNRARDLSLANMLAQNKAEMLRNVGYNSIPIGTTDFSTDLPAALAQPKTASYTVTQAAPGIKGISISLSYKDYRNTKTIEYKTYISEIGVGQ